MVQCLLIVGIVLTMPVLCRFFLTMPVLCLLCSPCLYHGYYVCNCASDACTELTVRPAVLYGMEMMAVTERQVGKMKVAVLKMVRWALGATRKDKIRNEYVRGTAKIAKLGDKLRNARLLWYGHVKRREEGYVGKTMMEMAVPGRRKRGRLRRRWMD